MSPATRPYLAFVAGKVTAQKLFDSLREKRVPSGRLSRTRAPAGFDIGAVSPEEIAVGILAEIVRVARCGVPEALETTAKDPVCGMVVEASRSKRKSKYRGATMHFLASSWREWRVKMLIRADG